MKKIIFYLISICSALVVTPTAFAAWYEVTGSSPIVSSSDTARLHALEDALYKAVNFAGGDIGNISNVRTLLSTEKDEYQFSNNEIRTIKIERTRSHNNTMYVKARIDIYPSATGCHVNQYKKTLLISQFDIQTPQQAVMGQINDLNQDFAKVLSRQFELDSQSFVSLGLSQYTVNEKTPERIKMVAEDTGAQYIITGEITDLSATIEAANLTQYNINRQFALEMKVFDGKTGTRVFDKTYRQVAIWPFSRTSLVDTSSARFWQSSYGVMLQRLTRDIMLDLESNMACKITLPEVVAKFDNTVTISLGRIHGVKQGDKLELWHTASFIDQKGLPRTKVAKSDITLTVSRVFDHDAEAKIDQADLAGSVQIGDVMEKKLQNDF
ncbi:MULTISPECIES: flagellar assembly protein FlgT [Vibrio]|uniref:Flagellar basal-body protein n=2 Tax=Vibrio TaxID=662 RepID=A0A7X4RSL5_9VIBR|nr:MULTISPECIES: flagellar assembly protein FlgT [Vibrio]MBF8999424.1 flagella assembly protein FlgT [Vibrio nitrifigilis]MZI91626.1 flagellar basal-body protein [Vibrio eleionomae]